MLIIEGPDGSGKTTLAKQLAKQLGWPIADRVVAADTTILGGRSSLKGWVDRNLDQGYSKTVYDRHRLISEPIYGPVMRHELQDGFDDYNWHSGAWQRLMQLRPFIIFCLPPYPIVVGNCRKEENNSRFSSTQLWLIYVQYWTLAARLSWPAITYDYTGQTGLVHPVDHLVNLVSKHTRRIHIADRRLDPRDGFYDLSGVA